MKVTVKPALLTWARERADLALATLATRLKVNPERVEAWEETGELTFKQLEALAQKTYTPLGYLFLPEPPEETLPIPDFRTVNDDGVRRPSPNLLDTIYAMQRRQAWLRETLIEDGAEPMPFVGSANIRQQPEAVAGRIREALKLVAGWAEQASTWTAALKVLREAIEAAGVMVVVNGVVGNNTSRKLDVEEFRGFVLIDNYAPLVFINGADAKAAQMFTMAHELAHVWIGQPGVFTLDPLQPANNAVERFCNRVAAEFLIPAADMREAWPDAEAQEEPFQVLAKRYKVSPLVAARRALDMQLIDRDAFFEFYNAYQEDERRKKRPSSGGDFYATQGVRIGRRFGDAVVRAVKEGRLMYGEAYELTGLRESTFNQFAEKLGYSMQ
jgi:Zn-dependent peptidase ImmA (M78 family)